MPLRSAGSRLSSLLTLLLLAARGESSSRPAAFQEEEALQRIEARVVQRQKELGIPGVGLVIVKGGQVIYMKGLGYRDREARLPVTPRTLFRIASVTKSFTAMLAMMAQEAGKLSTADNPRKYLPYFKLSDPEASNRVTISNLLSHSSGLVRADLAATIGGLSRKDLIRTMGDAKLSYAPGAGFGYQNTMYTAVGEIVSRVFHTPYERLVSQRIFEPLGMTRSNLSLRRMLSDPDHSVGYSAGPASAIVSGREESELAPAGGINSSLEDMSKYLRLMLNKGVFEGRRLFSEQSYRELTTRRVEVRPGVGYGYGWFLADWKGHQEVRHPGNVPGFNADVGMLPAEQLGYVLLTNVSDSALSDEIDGIVWGNLLGVSEVPAAPAPFTPKPLPASVDAVVGTYRGKGVGGEFKVYLDRGKLFLQGPNQPTVELLYDDGSRYRMGPPAPTDFVATFRPDASHPQEIGLFLDEGSMKFELSKVPNFKPPITGAELMSRAVAAAGQEHLREHQTMVVRSDLIYETEGVHAKSVTLRKAPNSLATTTEFFAAGKRIGTVHDYFDGRQGATTYSWAGTKQKTGPALAAAMAESDFLRSLKWKDRDERLEILRVQKVEDEEAYVLERTPRDGRAVQEYYSTKTFLLLRRDSPGEDSTTFSDYRSVAGVMIPFRDVTIAPGVGRVVSTVRAVSFDVKVPDATFAPKGRPRG